MNNEIIIIGAAILDVLVRPASADVFRTGSSAAEDIRMAVGADALNEATILAKMGKRVRLETVIGDDEAGSYILDHCKRLGIDVPEDAVRREYITGINVVLIQESGERNFLTNANGTLRKLTLKDIHMPFSPAAGILCFASIFVFPQIGCSELVQIFRQAKAQNLIVCADMTKRKRGETAEDLQEALAYVDYLLPNEEEACLLTGKEDAEQASRCLMEAGVKHVVVKCGSRGCLVRTARECYMVPADAAVECIDTTGAGDSFVAGFIGALSEGKTLRQCAEYANRCGGKAVQVVGATQWL